MSLGFRFFQAAILLASLSLVISGCASEDATENSSPQPWNSQQSWEHGMPAQINQGR
jgi:CBS-domain-containing membrane protein